MFEVVTRFGEQILHEDTEPSEVTVVTGVISQQLFLTSQGPVDLSKYSPFRLL